MFNFNTTMHWVRGFAVALFAVCISPAHAQFLTSPPQGSVYKEFTVYMTSSKDWRVTDPNAGNAGAQAYLPNPVLTVNVDDLQHATRAEVVIDHWGGHPGTTNKRFRFNSNNWIAIPELATTPPSTATNSQPQCFMQQWNPVVAVPLNHLKVGTNTLEGTSGGQTCFGFNWGQWGWYTVTLRVFYDPALKAHPTGAITSPSSGATFGENPTISANASGSAGISRVEFFAHYDGYDTDGDGRYLDYHHSYHRLKADRVFVPANHAGSDGTSPYSLTWNTSLVPDQAAGGVKVQARIRDNNGVWFVTNEVSNLTLQRTNSSVRLYKPENIPPRFWVRESRPTLSSNVTIPSGHNLSTASSAKLMVATWNGIDGSLETGQSSYNKVNDWTRSNFGKNHFYSYDVVDVPVSALKNGSNTITFHSQSSHHGKEVIWPGPAILVRYGSTTSPPSNQPPTASFTASPTSGDVPLTVSFNAGGSSDSDGSISSYAWNFGDGATASGVTTNHQYTSAGNYTATLTVTDNQGATGSTSMLISVNPVGGGGTGRVTTGLLALYSFDEGDGSVVNDISGTGTPLNLTIADPGRVSWLSGALAVNQSTVIASSGAATKVIDAVKTSGAVTLEAWLKSANTTQDGPARIATISDGMLERNITLGQGLWGNKPTDVFDARLRSTATNVNGTPSVTTPAGTASTLLTHVVYTRAANGAARLYVNGVQQASGTVGGNLSNWDNGFALGLANELGEDRPWLGELHLVAIYGTALSAAEAAQNYAAGPGAATPPTDPPPGGARVTDGLQALYAFTEGSGNTVQDTSGVGTPLNLTIQNTGAVNWSSSGLMVTGSTLIASPGPATKVINAVKASGAVSMEAWIRPANTTQNGPARIATISSGSLERNITLGQGLWGNQPSTVFDMRLRSTATDLNGRPSLSTPAGSATTALTHVVYTRTAAGQAKFYVNGVERASGTVGGNLSNWDAAFRLALANELDGSRGWLGTYRLMAIYGKALSAAEVGQNFDAGT